MSKRRRKHFIEGWCLRRITEIEEVDGDLELLAYKKGYTQRIEALKDLYGDGNPLGLLAPYSAAYSFVESGMNIYKIDDYAKEIIASTDIDKQTYDLAYDYLPFKCIYVEFNDEKIRGLFVKRNEEMHELQWLPVPKHGDGCYSKEDTVRFRNIAAYISSVNADINKVYEPSQKTARKKNGKRENRYSNATWHEVGYHVGAELRKYEREAYEKTPHQGGTKRPHMRRAHWHHYWIGSHKGERKLVLKWIPPIFVASKNGEIGGSTSHRVPTSGKADN